MTPAAPVHRCPRCDGLLYRETISGGLCDDVLGYRNMACFNCGNRIDEIILCNRLLHRDFFGSTS